MNMLVASLVFIPLFTVALACLLWAFGVRWPIKDRQLLARTVIGTDDVQAVPRLGLLAVCLVTSIASVLALSLADHDSGGASLTAVGVVLGLLFIARGAIGYTSFWQARTPDPIFRLNDRRVYSPVSLAIGVGFFVLVLMRLT